LGLCGIDKPDWMTGHDYSGEYLQDKDSDPAPDSAYLQSVIPTMHGDSVSQAWRGIVTDDNWKYVVFEGQDWLMFDLNEDPYEQVNLAHNTGYAAQRKRLNDRLAKWIADTDDEFVLPKL